MHTASEFMDAAGPRLNGLVRRAEHRAGSRMLAYGDVGRAIGTSASWVRKMMRGEAVGLPVHIYANIVARYDEACATIEHEAAIERERFLALGRQQDAVATGADQSICVASSADTAPERSAAPVVAPVVDPQRERLTPTSDDRRRQ